jgi:chemotaxis protein methyltransferase CheR
MFRDYILSEGEFNKFREIVYREAGIKLADVKKILVQARLMKRLRFLNLDSFEDYYNYLLENFDEEKINFINAITTNKTDFFRENDHFEYMKSYVLPAFESKGENEIRIWSAGCSTGEEPYSIGITLFEYFKGKKAPALKILATDIDTQVLEKGLNGVYTQEQVAAIDKKLLKEYFLKGTGENQGFFKVKDFLKNIVFFRRLNLLVDAYPMKKKFDVIFCRNVIIYFDKDTQRKLFDNFSRYLKDDGYLLVGHSENISSVTDKFFLAGRTIYRKVV